MKKRFGCVVGARPNFMKMAPILSAFGKFPEIETVLIHTGQHYDQNLSKVFFEELGIKAPDVSLGVGSGSHAKQTAEVMIAIEEVIVDRENKGAPLDLMIVVGDVNSTMAAALAAAKCHVPVAHIEAGLRSFDRTMPEEVNRVVTDSVSDLLLVSEPSGVENLLREGHAEHKIHLVGNVMIDTLLKELHRSRERAILGDLGLKAHEYGVVTLHRPANVDDPEVLENLLAVLLDCAERFPIVFPVHPRTRARMNANNLAEPLSKSKNLHLLEPLGYNDFLCLTSQAKFIITDSGGLQEESTALGIPCLTMRPNTERPITVVEGTSQLCGSNARLLQHYLQQIEEGIYKKPARPELWDGQAAERIATVLCNYQR